MSSEFKIKTIDDIDWSKWKKVSEKIAHTTNLPKNYTIKIVDFSYIDKSKNYCGIKVETILRDNEEVISFLRNYYADAPMDYVKLNGKEYIITSTDYQCITIINLTDKTQVHHCIGDYDKGFGFCPTGIEISVDNNFEDNTIIDHIIIEGCFWGCPYEYIKFNNIKDLDEFTILPIDKINFFPCDDYDIVTEPDV